MNLINKFVVISGLALFAITTQAAEKPNVIYIMIDNWGWGDVSYNGGETPTPNIDQLANEGIKFQNYNIQNQCTPSRAAMHTGRLPIRSGTDSVPLFNTEMDGLAPEEYTIAELLADSGYATAMYGKWHIGSREERRPHNQGYDEFWGFLHSSNDAAFTTSKGWELAKMETPYIYQGKKGKKSEKVVVFDRGIKMMHDDTITTKAIKWINEQIDDNKPFYTYVAFASFHPPLDVNPKFSEATGAGLYEDTKLDVDYQIGRIAKALKSKGMLDNTIFIVAGDNGTMIYGDGPAKKEGQAYSGSNGHWRGGLSTAFEGGMRTPAFMRYGKKVKSGQTTDEIVSDLDWYSTIAQLTGNKAKVPTDRVIDSIDQSEFILGNTKNSPRDYVVQFVGKEIYAVKWKNFKFHTQYVNKTDGPSYKPAFPLVYDLENDPTESKNIWVSDGYAHTWITHPVGQIIFKTMSSMEKCPNTPTGGEYVSCNQ
ncbi:sulfatase-like hydrolase/transferase [Thalassotalea nanhaiensis]|uniref:Sulfatase-like hydrolase/transferase n=1 Tax=Thalassotalea nanhaiensis TaxID=3065648 RepID=A0ABY9TEM4_9GAMM|nr:sulfatase-like hydrolase/transferase [Colwelliaceae bacterium SQ345]